MKTKIQAKIASGYGVASGESNDPRYPEGTLGMQIPYFKNLGLDLSGYFRGTLNVDISPYRFQIKNPKYQFKNINWSIYVPPENFYFFDINVVFIEKRFKGYIYMPDPKTKYDHPHPNTIIELVLPPISSIKNDNIILIEINEENIY